MLEFKSFAHELGFDACGIAASKSLYDKEEFITKWFAKQYHGDMFYLERGKEKRLHPNQVVPEVKSMIVLLTNYYPKQLQVENTYKIAKYAYGADYHTVLRARLVQLVEKIKLHEPTSISKAFTDTGPILEKHWATEAGLGSIGKNSLLIHPTLGTYHFISVILTSVELPVDIKLKEDVCKSCTKCMDACPTQALVEPRVLNASRCLSYLNHETKGAIGDEFKPLLSDYIFGCDICQDVCPHNKKAVPTTSTAFDADATFLSLTKHDWRHLTREQFAIKFNGTPLERAGYDKIMQTINLLSE